MSGHDAIVVGAGAIGLAVAWRAAQRGLSVCVVERDSPGAGASPLAAGLLIPVSEHEPREVQDLKLASARMFPRFAAELEEAAGEAVGYRELGMLYAALDEAGERELRELHGLQGSFALESQWLDAHRCRELEPCLAGECAGGVLAAEDAQVDPPALLRALEVAAARAGVEIVAGAEVVGAVWEGARLRGVETRDGRRFLGDAVVLAAGCWSGAASWLPREVRPPVRPVKGQILELRTSGDPLFSRPLHPGFAYLVSHGAGRVILGATVEEAGFDTAVTADGAAALLTEIGRGVPAIHRVELVAARAGLRPGTPDGAPVVGPTKLEGLLVASGHFRSGILLTPLTADAVSALLAGEEAPVPLEAFSPRRFAEG